MTDRNEKAVKLAFASATEKLVPGFVERMAAIAPELDLFVVSEFPPAQGRWIPYRVNRGVLNNYQRCKAALQGRRLAYSGLVLQPKSPYGSMRLLALLFGPLRVLFFNENLDHFMLRPSGVVTMLRHLAWRVRSTLRFELNPGGTVYTWAWRLRHPRELRRPLYSLRARIAGRLASFRKRDLRTRPAELPTVQLPAGVSVVIPSRNGKLLLAKLLPQVERQLDEIPGEIVVVDNGSDDGSIGFVRQEHPLVRIEASETPLSFAQAVNRGIAVARFSHVCLLNNDMALHPEFFAPLREAFEQVPHLFCATAQIFFEPGRRREETGKAVFQWPLQKNSRDFPVRCVEPLRGEDLSYVLYGSGGCSLYDVAKLRALAGIGEVYTPAYVEDLDAGFRAWQRGWPTVFVSRSAVTHEHRTTTSRYYQPAELDRALEVNFLRFLARAVSSPDLFRKLWAYAVRRLVLRAALEHHQPSLEALGAAEHAVEWVQPAPEPAMSEEFILGLTNGDVAVFPGRAARKNSHVVVASCYSPFPLSHGGAVRMYNLMRRAAESWSQILITFVDELHTPPAELLDICVEVIQVRRVGSHSRPDLGRPDVVEDFDSPAFHGVLRQTVRKGQPAIVQLEFTQMAQYAADAAPAKTVLVEHDITIDLYEQLVATSGDFDTAEQLDRWRAFEQDAWQSVNCVVTMSEKDRRTIEGAERAVTLANGVDLERFQPGGTEPESGRILFIGSFAHLPNLLALDFFLAEVFPLIEKTSPVLHVIAGSNHEYHFSRHKDRLRFRLDHPGIELEGFVSDVRPAYNRAAAVIAPLLASAGTNIKVMEAMAMGKAIVSTPAGVNGLEVTRGTDVLIESDPTAFADAILRLLEDAPYRSTLGGNARKTVERVYGWDAIAAQQDRLYRQLLRS